MRWRESFEPDAAEVDGCCCPSERLPCLSVGSSRSDQRLCARVRGTASVLNSSMSTPSSRRMVSYGTEGPDIVLQEFVTAKREDVGKQPICNGDEGVEEEDEDRTAMATMASSLQ